MEGGDKDDEEDNSNQMEVNPMNMQERRKCRQLTVVGETVSDESELALLNV